VSVSEGMQTDSLQAAYLLSSYELNYSITS